MGANDNFQFGRTQPLGKVSFGDTTYSDQFVRAPTADLSAAKKKTSPLAVTGELVEEMRTKTELQLQTCRTILDKFDQRMRILRWASEVARQTAATPVSPPEPDPPPAKKGFLARQPVAAKPARSSKPTSSRPPAPPKTTVAISPQEQAIGVVIARIVATDPEVQRQVQIALYQYGEAVRAVGDALTGLARTRELDLSRAFDQIEKLEIAKVQGKIYPLTNFSEVFKAHPQIARLFPPPMPRK